MNLTPMQVETLKALYELNKRSRKFKGVDEIALKRLEMRGWKGERSKGKSYFGMYRSSTHKMLEELTRKGYVDQSDMTLPGGGIRPYKITEKGKMKTEAILADEKPIKRRK